MDPAKGNLGDLLNAWTQIGILPLSGRRRWVVNRGSKQITVEADFKKQAGKKETLQVVLKCMNDILKKLPKEHITDDTRTTLHTLLSQLNMKAQAYTQRHGFFYRFFSALFHGGTVNKHLTDLQKTIEELQEVKPATGSIQAGGAAHTVAVMQPADSSPGHAKPLTTELRLDFANSVDENARVLAAAFLELKQKAPAMTGYKVRLFPKQPAGTPYILSLQPEGTERTTPTAPLPMPGSKELKSSCTKCKHVYDETFASYKIKEDSLFKKIVDAVAPYGMKVVKSISGNLLIVPDTTADDIKKEDYKNLYELDKPRLEWVFAALLTTLQHLTEQGYKPDIEWHCGAAANQTVDMLHTRVQKLDPELQKRLFPEESGHTH